MLPSCFTPQSSLISCSSQKFIRTKDRAGRGSVASASVGAQFSVQLGLLRARIDATEPHYIRCLKPNDAMVPDDFDPAMIVDQLRYGGVLEAVRVSRAGYPTRYPHGVFRARYYVLGYGRVKDEAAKAREGSEVEQLIAKIAFDIWEEDHEQMTMEKGQESRSNNAIIPNGVAYPVTAKEFHALDFSDRCAIAGMQLGRTKVFLRREALDRIEGLRAQKFGVSALTIQRTVRGAQARIFYIVFRRRMIHAAIVVQRGFRGCIERLVLAPSAIKVQAIARGAIVRMRLSTQPATASKKTWVPFRELEQVQAELDAVILQKDGLLAVEEIWNREMNSILQRSVPAVTVARVAMAENVQKEPDEKVLPQKEISALNSTCPEEETGDNLENAMRAVRRKFDDLRTITCQEKEEYTSKISTLKAELVASEEEHARLSSDIKSIRCRNKEVLADVEGEKAMLGQELAELLSVREILTTEVQSYKTNVAELTSARDASARNLQKELDEKVLLQNEVSSLNSNLTEVTVAKNTVTDKLEQDLLSLRKKVDVSKKKADQKKEQLSSKMSSLEAQLLESKAEKDRQDSSIKLTECDHAQAMARVSSENSALVRQNEALSKQKNALSDEVEKANETIRSLRRELDAAKKSARNEQKQHCLKMSEAEKSLLESKQEQDRLENLVKSLKTFHADAVENAEIQRTGFTKAKETASQEHERLRAKIKGLMEDLIESKKQMTVCEAKMDQSGVAHPKDRTFEDILLIINKECSDIVAKAKIAAKELESSTGMQILTKKTSNFQLHDFALDQFSNYVMEVEMDGGVKRLLISCCSMVESAEVSVL